MFAILYYSLICITNLINPFMQSEAAQGEAMGGRGMGRGMGGMRGGRGGRGMRRR